jgi:hypothetical protein
LGEVPPSSTPISRYWGYNSKSQFPDTQKAEFKETWFQFQAPISTSKQGIIDIIKNKETT